MTPVTIIKHMHRELGRDVHLFRDWFSDTAATTKCGLVISVQIGNVLSEPKKTDSYCKRCYTMP